MDPSVEFCCGGNRVTVAVKRAGAKNDIAIPIKQEHIVNMKTMCFLLRRSTRTSKIVISLLSFPLWMSPEAVDGAAAPRDDSGSDTFVTMCSNPI